MSKKALKFEIIVCVILMFGLLFLNLYLTDFKAMKDYSQTDEYIFAAFIIAELLVVAALIFLSNKYNKLYPSARSREQEPDIPVPPSVKKIATTHYTLSFVIVLLAWGGGLYFSSITKDAYRGCLLWTNAASGLLPLLTIIGSLLLKRLYVNKFKKMNFGERQNYIASHRDEAYKTVEQKKKTLKRIHTLSRAYAILFILCGAILVFSYQGTAVFAFLASFILIRTGLANFYPFINNDELEGVELISEEDYPVIFGLARKAADRVGWKKEIRITIECSFNAMIARGDGYCLVNLGVLLINNLTEDELYAILLHEFAHMKAPTIYNEKGVAHKWLSCPYVLLPYEKLSIYMIDYPATLWQFNHNMYMYASSIMLETDSDKAMLLCGDIEAAASALLKVYYDEMHQWEKGTYDTDSLFVSEEYNRGTVRRELALYKKAVEKHAELWNGYAKVAIISRATTHPTLKMRLETLGVSEMKILTVPPSLAYKAEQDKAVEFAEDLFAKRFETEEKYADIREREYVKPKELIEEWENAGKPIVAEEYADVIDALRTLCRNTEANEVAKQAMEVLDEGASHYAHYMYGAFLLHCFNDEGIEYIYKAIETNTNYFHEGMHYIGAYCCMTGNQERLDEYRQRASELGQEYEDKYGKTGYIVKDDTLVTEKLPDGLLEDILSYINRIDEGVVERIHLVRKVITEDFFTSAFVITFTPETELEQLRGIMHKIFHYLDTCYDWQFSLFCNTDVPMDKIIAVEDSLVYKKEV